MNFLFLQRYVPSNKNFVELSEYFVRLQNIEKMDRYLLDSLLIQFHLKFQRIISLK